jgi:hypothetical protein
MCSSVELFARLLQLLAEELPRTEGMLSFRINSLQAGVSADGGFRLEVATARTSDSWRVVGVRFLLVRVARGPRWRRLFEGTE